MKYSTDIVVLDLEATCPQADMNRIEESSIIEIGAVRLDRRSLEETSAFSELVKPSDLPLPDYITAITGITTDMVARADTFDKVAQRFCEWYGNRNRAVLAVWGAYYDIPLLRKEFDTFGLDYKANFVGGAMDIRALAMAWLAMNARSTTGVTVEGVIEKTGVAVGTRLHRALDDARAEAAVLRAFHATVRAAEPSIMHSGRCIQR